MNLTDGMKKLVNATKEKLDALDDGIKDGQSKLKKSKLGRKITYITGGDPDADKILGYEKHDLPEDQSKVLDAFNEFLGEQSDQEEVKK